MARPAEKARSMLNKWTTMRDAETHKIGGGGGGSSSGAGQRRSGRRPHLASECEHLADAERFRGQIIREIAEAIRKIQNPGLGEHALRELNDEINHRLREKWHWNKRIYQLGGLDYNDIERKRQIEEGDTQIHAGYRYFGAAKDLPGVREHLEQLEAKQKKVTRGDLFKNITPDYFGWRDEEDGVLLEVEARVDQEAWKDKRYKRLRVDESIDQDDYLAVPSQEQIDRAMLEHKKKELLKKYDL